MTPTPIPQPPAARVLRVAIVGSGPAGLFTAEELLSSGRPVAVDVFDKNPEPYGLVRYGVAPDHPQTRRVTRLFALTAAKPGCRIFLGVEIGKDRSLDQLRADYDAVVIATGAEQDRPLNIPGENLPGVHTSLAFAGWVNGHPDFQNDSFNLFVETAVLIGLGNVALDVARLLVRPDEFLASTDIAPAARIALAASRVRHVLIVGRRGPAEAAFGAAEIEEIGALADCDVTAEWPAGATLPPDADDRQRDVFTTLRRFSGQTAGKRPHHLHFRFGLHPTALEGAGRVERAVFTRADGSRVEMPCGLVIKSIGHQAVPLPGLPYDAQRGVIPATDHRIAPRLYAVGWVKRGAHGLIGHNRRDAVDTARAILQDF